MESTAYFHRIYGIVPWNPLNFHGINGKNLWHFMNFHNFLLLVYLPSTAMETLKTPSEYSVDFNRGFQVFSMANLETGDLHENTIFDLWVRVTENVAQYPLHHVTYSDTKFEVATFNGLCRAACTRQYII